MPGINPGRPARSIILSVLLAAAAWGSGALALDPGRALTQFRLTSWSQEDGLPQNTVTSIVQTRDGYLWMGTEEGLVRFDGVRFVVSDRQSAPALGSPFVSALGEDSGGTLWIGTYGGGIARMRGETIEAFRPELLGSERVRYFHATPDGVTFVATAGGGLLRLAGKNVTRFTTRDGLPNDRLWTVVGDGEGGYWIGTHGGGVVRWRDGQVMQRLSTREGFPNDFARALLRDRDGMLWVGTDGAGVVGWRDGAIVRTLTVQDGLPSNLVRSLLRDRDGSLWIGTDGGLARWRGGKIDALGMAQGLPSPNIRALFEDHEGSLWVGTTGGLIQLRNTRFAALTRKEGLSADGIRAIFEDRAGRVWAGTEGGGLCRVHPGPVKCLNSTHGLPHNTVFALAESRDGSLWIGTDGGGVTRLRDGNFVETIDARGNGLPNDRVRALLEAADGSLWVGTSAGLALVRGGQAVRVAGLGDLQIRGLLALPNGTLLVGTDGAGLWRVEDVGARATLVAAAGRGLESDRVFSLAASADGGIWIGTSGGGLSRLDPDSGAVQTLTRRDGLHDDVVFHVIDDRAGGNLWLTSNRGFYRVGSDRVLAAMRGGKADLSGTVFGTPDGLPSAECNAAFPGAVRTRDGRLWVATARGLAVVDPAATFRNTVPPPVHVEETIIDNTIVHPQRLDVPPGTQRFEIRYTALSLRAPELVRFRHRLEGYDEKWVEAGSARVAHYTQLAPGSYTFRVVAANDDGIWSQSEARLQVTVDPRWYETWWARLSVLVLLASVIGGGVRLRLATMHRRQAELEAMVAERTSSLRAERERAEAASRAKSDFLANMSHELRTPLNAVLGFVQLMERRSGRDAEDREHLAIISRSGEHLLGLINDVLSLAKIEAGLATRADAPFEFGRLLRGLGELLQIRAGSKGLTVRIEVTPSAEVTVLGDEGKLRQIILNFLSNAVKFTEHGGVVLRAAWADGRGVVEVEDTGPGIDAQELPRVFETFAQTETGRRAKEGAGLGLAISRSLARIHGGDVTIRSSPGTGTTVRLEAALPPVSEAPIRKRGRRTGRVVGIAPGQTVPKILVVDDSPENRRLLRELLVAVGCRVTEATNGENAMARWRENAPDLIFMDLRMQGMGGMEAMNMIRAAQARGEGPPSRIVAVSASALEHERTLALANGADVFLAKPFREGAVFAQLEQLLGIRLIRMEEADAPTPFGQSGLDPERLASLPAELRRRLAAAAAGGEGDVLQSLATEAGSHDAALGTDLAALAKSYRFDEIEAALAGGDATGERPTS